MVKDSKASAGDGGPVISETSAPRVPSYENLISEEQVAFGMSYDLLRHNLERLPLPRTATADAEAEAEEASRRLLGNGRSVDSVLRSPPGSQLNNSSLGREMLRLSEEFRASRQGREADAIADRVNLVDLNEESFTAILERLFHRGYNVESFVTLFHFVARLLHRAYSERGDAGFRSLCHNLILAFMTYLLTNVIKFLVSLFRSITAERKVAALGFLSGLLIASVVFGGVGFYLMKSGRQ